MYDDRCRLSMPEPLGGIEPNKKIKISYFTSLRTYLLILPIIIIIIATLPYPITAIAPKYETAYACEGKTLTIECDAGDLINLIRANYGRFSITICNDHGNVDWSVNCMSGKSLRVLHSKCAHKQNCSVLASTNMFGDPCAGTHKYLEAHYQCVSAAQTSTTTNRPSPPWLITSQPSVWSTSTIRVPTTTRNVLESASSVVDGGGDQITKSPNQQNGGSSNHGATATSTTMVVNSKNVAGIKFKPINSASGAAKFSPSISSSSSSSSSSLPSSSLSSTPTTSATSTASVTSSASATSNSNQTIINHSQQQQQQHHHNHHHDPPQWYGNSTLVSSQFPSLLPSSGNTNGASGGSSSTSGGPVSNNKDGRPISMNNNDGVNDNGGYSTQSPTVLLNTNFEQYFCGPKTARNLFWNLTRVGEVNVQPCPGGATGIAKWRCVYIHQQQQNYYLNNQQRFTMDDDDVDGSTSDGSSSIQNNHNVNNNVAGLIGLNKLAPIVVWQPATPDLTHCRSLWLNSLEARVNQRDSSLISIANDLSLITNSKTLYGGDMLVTTKIIQIMSEKMTNDIETFADQRQREEIILELLHGVVKTGSNLLDTTQHLSWLDLSFDDQMRVATSLLTGLEDNAFLLADTIVRERNVVQKDKNILLSVRVLETRNIVGNEIFPDETVEQWNVSDDSIELPRGALIENSEGGLVRIVFVAFDRLETILKPAENWSEYKYFLSSGVSINNNQNPNDYSQHSQHHPNYSNGNNIFASSSLSGGILAAVPPGPATSGGVDDASNSDNGAIIHDAAEAAALAAATATSQTTNGVRNRILNSKVISASLGKGRHIQLSQPIRLILKHLKIDNVSNPMCVFWNYIDHAWSEDGCYVESTNRTHTICMCNHLTNFAILMDIVNESQTSLLSIFDDNMRILIYVSIAICILFIIVALLALKLFSGIFIKSSRTTIYKNLYVCLTIVEILFLFGIEQSETSILCGFTTAFLHCAFLCTVAWVFFEVFQLYITLTTEEILLDVEKSSRIIWYYLMSYGVSFTIVAISLVIDPGSYTQAEYCLWTESPNLFYFTFLSPIFLYILATIVYSIMSTVRMCKNYKTSLKNKEHTRLASIRFYLKCSFLFLLIFTTCWTFAYLFMMNVRTENSIGNLFGYFFVILNALQGFYIFAFHCMNNEKIRREYEKYMRQQSWLPKCLQCTKSSSLTATTTTTTAGAVAAGAASVSSSASPMVVNNQQQYQHHQQFQQHTTSQISNVMPTIAKTNNNIAGIGGSSSGLCGNGDSDDSDCDSDDCRRFPLNMEQQLPPIEYGGGSGRTQTLSNRSSHAVNNKPYTGHRHNIDRGNHQHQLHHHNHHHHQQYPSTHQHGAGGGGSPTSSADSTQHIFNNGSTNNGEGNAVINNHHHSDMQLQQQQTQHDWDYHHFSNQFAAENKQVPSSIESSSEHQQHQQQQKVTNFNTLDDKCLFLDRKQKSIKQTTSASASPPNRQQQPEYPFVSSPGQPEEYFYWTEKSNKRRNIGGAAGSNVSSNNRIGVDSSINSLGGSGGVVSGGDLMAVIKSDTVHSVYPSYRKKMPYAVSSSSSGGGVSGKTIINQGQDGTSPDLANFNDDNSEDDFRRFFNQSRQQQQQKQLSNNTIDDTWRGGGVGSGGGGVVQHHYHQPAQQLPVYPSQRHAYYPTTHTHAHPVNYSEEPVYEEIISSRGSGTTTGVSPSSTNDIDELNDYRNTPNSMATARQHSSKRISEQRRTTVGIRRRINRDDDYDDDDNDNAHNVDVTDDDGDGDDDDDGDGDDDDDDDDERYPIHDLANQHENAILTQTSNRPLIKSSYDFNQFRLKATDENNLRYHPHHYYLQQQQQQPHQQRHHQQQPLPSVPMQPPPLPPPQSHIGRNLSAMLDENNTVICYLEPMPKEI